ncbi:hypothetical protein LINGRAHAP2_LOCUS14846, partial [Linum grandiflorum]
MAVVDASGVDVQVSLRSELLSIIDAETIVLDDVANPVIVAFSAFRIHIYYDKTHASNTLSSRISFIPWMLLLKSFVSISRPMLG